VVTSPDRIAARSLPAVAPVARAHTHAYIPAAAFSGPRNRARRCVDEYHSNRGVRMARRSDPPPKPKSPVLTVGQKRRRIERLQKCVMSLEEFDPQKARKRTPAVLTLEAAIDKAGPT
jgi:hypothetical protein